ncbi:MAG: hypothetical protein CVT89_02600 [Candidatus Altiarchaeales archaeon HGW-Altiarchaeales-2]|nr:MAG: hypothetical protein CVT89_02600 [Candidatus Altiarchaeales archaeon HGW-Altiarchaeales-2]
MLIWEDRLNAVMSECSKYKNWKEMAIQDAIRVYTRAGEIDKMNEYIRNTELFSKKGKYRDTQPIYYQELEILRELICIKKFDTAKELFEKFPKSYVEKDIKRRVEKIHEYIAEKFNDWFIIALALNKEDLLARIPMFRVTCGCPDHMHAEHLEYDDPDILPLGYEINEDNVWWRLASAGKLSEGVDLWISRFFKDAKKYGFSKIDDYCIYSVRYLKTEDAVKPGSSEHQILEYLPLTMHDDEVKNIFKKQHEKIEMAMRVARDNEEKMKDPNRNLIFFMDHYGALAPFLSLIRGYSRLNDKKAIEFAELIAKEIKPREEYLKGKKVSRRVETPFRNFIAPVFARFDNIDSGKELLHDGEKIANHFTTVQSKEFRRSWRNIKLYDVMVGYARLGMADDVIRILRKLHGLKGEERFEKFEKTPQKPTIFKMAPYQPYCNLQSNDLMVAAYLLYSGFKMKKVALELLEDAYHISFNNLKSWIKEEPDGDTGIVVTPLHHIFEIIDQFRKIENDWTHPVLPIYNKLDI